MKIELHIDDSVIRPFQVVLRRRFVLPVLVAIALFATGAAAATTFLGPFAEGETLTASSLNDRFDQLYDAISDVEGKAASSGTYMPTFHTVSNISVFEAYEAQWLRVGNVVTVSGRLDFTATAVGTEFELTYPAAAPNGAASWCGGTGTDGKDPWAVIHDIANSRATFHNANAPVGAKSIWYTYTYRIQ